MLLVSGPLIRARRRAAAQPGRRRGDAGPDSDEDPYTKAGMAQYELLPWAPNSRRVCTARPLRRAHALQNVAVIPPSTRRPITASAVELEPLLVEQIRGGGVDRGSSC